MTEGLRRDQLGEALRPMAMDPATLDKEYDPGYSFNDWSPLIVGALKTLYKVKPRWSIVTDDDERSILVLLTHEKENNMPSGLRGDDGNSYSYHSIERYFL